MDKLLISIIAPPGAGKSTILRQLADKHQIPVLSSGDLARQLKTEMETDFDKRGQLAPEEAMREKLMHALDKLYEHHTVVLADGFPRSVDQYDWLCATFPHVQIQLYHLYVPYSEVVRRLLARGRADDTQEIIQNRIKTYEYYTQPIVHLNDLAPQTPEQIIEHINRLLHNKMLYISPQRLEYKLG